MLPESDDQHFNERSYLTFVPLFQVQFIRIVVCIVFFVYLSCALLSVLTVSCPCSSSCVLFIHVSDVFRCAEKVVVSLCTLFFICDRKRHSWPLLVQQFVCFSPM